MVTKTMTQKEKILARLEDGIATSADLNKICYRYSARILELRKQGYNITSRYLKPGLHIYKLEDKE